MMHTPRTSRAAIADRAARGFTLIEVMISVVIIGLGVLGLSAIFAGAASQQVASARTTEAAELTASLDRLLRDRAGAPTVGYGARVPPNVGAQVTLNSGPNDQYPLGLRVPLTPTVWFPLSSYPFNALQGYPSYATTLDPRVNPVNEALSVFFLNDAPGIEIYHNPLDATAINPKPVYHRTQLLPAGPQRQELVLGGAGQFDEPFYGPDGPRIKVLDHARIQPGTLRVRFEIARKDALATSAAIVGRRVVRFDDAAWSRDNDGSFYPSDDVSDPLAGLLRPQSIVTPNVDDRLLFHRMPFPRRDFITLSINPPVRASMATILEFDIALGANEWIERIVVEPYQWRSDVLLTLADRVRPSLDGSSVGVAPLMQGGFSGSGRRMGMFVYVAEPVQRGAEWIPPETGPINERLLRREQVTLGYDETLRSYYIRVTDPDDAWLTEIGQRLLVAGDPAGDPYSNLDESGADAFVRVVRQDRRASNDFRGVLDLGPTTNGAPFVLPDSGTELDLDVWALFPIAKSAAPGEPVFRITPIDSTVIQTR